MLELIIMPDSFHVDGCISSMDSDLDAVHFKNLGMSALGGAGMELRKI